MKASNKFLKKLLLKLKTGNRRSIHLNALPNRYTRLDLFELINIHSSLHLKFITLLLSKENFSLKVSVDFKQIQKKTEAEVSAVKKMIKILNALFYQQRDEFLEHGTQTFAFGYPLLVKRDITKSDAIIKAPFILWYLNIEKDTSVANTWILSRNENSPTIFNEVLRTYIETNEGINFDEMVDIVDQNFIDEQKLLSIAKHTLEKLGTTTTAFDEELLVLPSTNKDSIEKLTKEDPWIRWSGIFGLYKTQKQSIIKDINALLEEKEFYTKTDKALTEKQNRKEPLSAVPIDPSQEKMLYAVEEHQKIVIQGPPGTGKSQSLTALISNALYQGKTCLVVCEKKTALEVIQQNLKAKGLYNQVLLLEDVYRDRKKVVDKVRQLLETRNDVIEDFRAFEFQEKLTIYEEEKKKINHHLTTLNTKFFGDDKAINLIAKLHQLKAAKVSQKIDFGNIAAYQFNYEEFQSLKKVIAKAFDVYKPIANEDIPFKIVKDEYFTTNFETLEANISKIYELNHEIELLLLKGKSIDQVLFNKIKSWKNWKLTTYSIFSKKIKSLKDLKITIELKYQQLISAFENYPFIDYSFSNLEQIDNYSDLENRLNTLSKTLNPIYKNKQNLKIYQPWRIFIIEQKTHLQSLLYFLQENVDINLWKDSFDISYIEQTIENYCYKNNLDASIKENLIAVENSDHVVRKALPKKIISDWTKRQQAILKKRTINNIKHLYNYRSNKTYGKRNSIRNIVHHDVELFQTAFPVVLTNPSVCSSVFPLKADLFDMVLFDEASQLRIEDTYTALLRGRQKVVSGDQHQMPPPDYFQQDVVFNEAENTDIISDDFLAESQSLLAYAMDTDFQSTYLDFHYRSKHPDLIAFSNHAFYGNRLVPMPQQHHYKAFNFFEVKGIYHKNRTNTIEAAAVVEYLLNIPLDQNQNYPSVGIATFNLNQRNLIWDLLMEKGYEKTIIAKQIAGLVAAGLFVKNLENIQGDERDIMLISTTFAPNEKGEFRQNFGPITSKKGYKLLNVIITRAKQKVAVFTSIPKTSILNFAEEIAEKGNNGKAIFYAYLQYVQAIENGNMESKANILALVNEHCQAHPYQYDYKNLPLFNQLIYTELQQRLNNETIEHNYQFGGFNLELVIVSNDYPKIVIFTEHQTQNQPAAYRLYLFKKQILEQYGIKVILLSANQWFKNWVAKMASLIDEIEVD